MLGGAGSSSSSRPVEMGALKNEGHWAGTIAAPVTYVVDPNGKVKWAYTSANASDRPSPVALAKAAVAIASGKEPPAEYPGKN